MKFQVSLFFLTFSSLLPAALGAPLPCPPAAPDEPHIYMSDSRFGLTLPEMKELFDKQYQSGKRLKGRAYWSEAEGAYVLVHPVTKGKVRVDPQFLRNITRHAEIALERRYADFLFFPDMGHSHFFLPEKSAETEAILKFEPSEMHLAYERMLAHRGLKVLYHTAEQLLVRPSGVPNAPYPQSRYLLWREFSRNPIGDNVDGENIAPHLEPENDSGANTVRELKDHHYWSSGFNISAGKNGCFPFRAPDGSMMRFDISLEDLPYSSSDQPVF